MTDKDLCHSRTVCTQYGRKVRITNRLPHIRSACSYDSASHVWINDFRKIDNKSVLKYSLAGCEKDRTTC
jgi:hypothetical protein